MLRHKRIVHSQDRRSICEVCGQVFVNNDKLSLHLMNHKKRFKCNTCNSLWSTSYNLKTHMLSHTGEKPHKCEVCQQAFSRLDNLKLHLKLKHKDVPRYECKKCHKKFKTNKEKVDHAREHHKKVEVDKVCNLCGLTLCARGPAHHSWLHRQDKILKCEQCEKHVILTKQRYKYNIPNKDNRIITVCHGCFEDFAQTFEPEKYESLRIRHVFTHKCRYCDRCFSQKIQARLAPHEASCSKRPKTSRKIVDSVADTVITDKDLASPTSDGEQPRSDLPLSQSSCSEIVPEKKM